MAAPFPNPSALPPPDAPAAGHVALAFDQFTAAGLYLLFDDGLSYALTRTHIDEMRHRYLADSALIPDCVRKAPAYGPCVVCPHYGHADFCHAIPTVFPFLEGVDHFLSHDTVTAVFRPEADEDGNPSSSLHSTRTSLQHGLQYVAILSLMYYCEVGRAYFKYFSGVNPIGDPFEIFERVYLNIFWDCKGELDAVAEVIRQMRREIDVTIHCQVQRLQLFCKNDAFVNAFVIAFTGLQLLDTAIESRLRDRFKSHPSTAGLH